MNLSNNSNEIISEINDTVRPPNFPNINYKDNVTLTEFLNCLTYATIWFETLDTFAPLGYVEAPCTQALLHNRPMEEDLIEFATIFKLDNTESLHSTFCQLMKMGILPTVQQLFTARPWDYPVQFQLWLDTIHFYVKHKLLELQCKTRTSTYLTVTDMDSCIQLTFYPIGAIGPTLYY